MVTEKKKIGLLVGTIVAVVAAIAVMFILYVARRPDAAAVAPVTPRPSAEVIVREKEVETLVTVEKEITAEILTDGVRDLGVLVTDEYYFTEVVSFSSIKKLWKIDLGITESSYLASYDGVVTAGVDLETASVEKDEEQKRITVTLPAAEIQNVDIDPESFVLYSEKAGLGNHLSVEDFNSSLIELEQTARDKAMARGILERADDNARSLVRNLIGSLVDLGEYTLVFAEG